MFSSALRSSNLPSSVHGPRLCLLLRAGVLEDIAAMLTEIEN